MLLDAYDAALFDLDGVLYVGPDAVDGAAEAVRGVRAAGRAVGYVTNNASRTPDAVAQHLARLGIAATPDDVVTSAQAIARVMADRLPAGARVMVVGSDALAAEVGAVGLVPVGTMAEDPAALVQGYHAGWTVADLQEACVAVHAGLPWYASNLDLTIPTDRGIMPGMGSWVNLVSAACGGARPVEVAGKPYPPLLEATVERVGCTRPLFVGDRLDTDIEGAAAVGMDSLFVLTGAHGPGDLLAAPVEQRPTHLGWNALALLDDPLELRPELVDVAGTTARLTRRPGDLRERLEALWALAHAVWEAPGTDAREALSALGLGR